MENAFREYIRIPDELFPEAWKNLPTDQDKEEHYWKYRINPDDPDRIPWFDAMEQEEAENKRFSRVSEKFQDFLEIKKSIKKIYNTAIDLLVNLGIGEVPERLFKDLIAIGAKDNGSGRVLFPKNLIEEAMNFHVYFDPSNQLQNYKL